MKRSGISVAGEPRAYSAAEGVAWLSSARGPLTRALSLSEILDFRGDLPQRIAAALVELDALEQRLREHGL
jgi:hypothetical protein